jgi:hypothetical protein
MIVNNFTRPVILDDDRDPAISWAHHRARGSLGGVDLAYPMNTPVLANATGVIENIPWYGSGGHTVRLHLADRRYIEYMHLNSFSHEDGDIVTVGEEIGKSGASGNGEWSYYGPHLHVHLVAGNIRLNLFDFFDQGNQQNTPTEEDDMYDANARDEVVGRMDRQIIPLLQTLVARSRGLVAFRSDPNVEFQGKRGAGEIFIAAPGLWFHAPGPYWALARARGVVDEPINIGWNEVAFWRDVIYLGAERNDQEILAILRDQFPEADATAITAKLASS